MLSLVGQVVNLRPIGNRPPRAGTNLPGRRFHLPHFFPELQLRALIIASYLRAMAVPSSNSRSRLSAPSTATLSGRISFWVTSQIRIASTRPYPMPQMVANGPHPRPGDTRTEIFRYASELPGSLTGPFDASQIHHRGVYVARRQIGKIVREIFHRKVSAFDMDLAFDTLTGGAAGLTGVGCRPESRASFSCDERKHLHNLLVPAHYKPETIDQERA